MRKNRFPCFLLGTQVTGDDLVNNAYLRLNGKLPTFTAGSSKYDSMLAIGNMQIGVWENAYDWSSLRDSALSFGTVTATDTFALPVTVNYISKSIGDTVKITRLDGTIDEYETVSIDVLHRYSGNYCAQKGRSLVFADAFTSTSPQFGGTIKAPVYLYASRLTDGSSTVPVDDPNWLFVASAAQSASASIVKANMYGDLLQEARGLMENMIQSDSTAQVSSTYSEPFIRGSEW